MSTSHSIRGLVGGWACCQCASNDQFTEPVYNLLNGSPECRFCGHVVCPVCWYTNHIGEQLFQFCDASNDDNGSRLVAMQWECHLCGNNHAREDCVCRNESGAEHGGQAHARCHSCFWVNRYLERLMYVSERIVKLPLIRAPKSDDDESKESRSSDSGEASR